MGVLEYVGRHGTAIVHEQTTLCPGAAAPPSSELLLHAEAGLVRPRLASPYLTVCRTIRFYMNEGTCQDKISVAGSFARDLRRLVLGLLGESTDPVNWNICRRGNVT